MRGLVLLLISASLASSRASADPGVHVDYRDWVLRVTLDGSYAGTYYLGFRSDSLTGSYAPVANQYTLCTGDCYITDAGTRPGRTYFYRFDLQVPGGGTPSYGPYPVTVPDTPLGVRIWPNPSGSHAVIQLSTPGSGRWDAPLPAEARVIDLQGRTVRVLFAGALNRGRTSLDWDGLDQSGHPAAAGVFFVRLTTPIGSSAARLLRIR
jgi:hypothetical protein